LERKRLNFAKRPRNHVPETRWNAPAAGFGEYLLEKATDGEDRQATISSSDHTSAPGDEDVIERNGDDAGAASGLIARVCDELLHDRHPFVRRGCNAWSGQT
jgi:hypothetical protein